MAVSVYSTPSCVHCTRLKEYLRERQVQYQDIDVSRDERKAAEMVHKSRQQGVPVTDFHGTIVVGFDRDKIDRLISRHR
jgi:glutaredoxin-like YruB-family protein